MALRSGIKHHQVKGETRTTPPSAAPVSLATLKGHLRISDTADDAYLADLITTATELLTDHCGLCAAPQVWEATFDFWPVYDSEGPGWWDGVRQGSIYNVLGNQYRSLELPKYPLASVSEIEFTDPDGVAALEALSDYQVMTGGLMGEVKPNDNYAPTAHLRQRQGIRIQYAAGYGTAGSYAETDTPAPIRHAIMLMASFLYEHRGDCGMPTGSMLTASGAKAHLAPYMRARL